MLHDDVTDKGRDIDQLNDFLRRERSAVETYDRCISKVGDPELADKLETLRDSHQLRVALLEARIRELGGTPSEDAGVWGSYAELVEGSASLFPMPAALAALAEGEDHGQNVYQNELDELSPESRSFVQTQLLAEQLHTLETMSEIKKAV
jgi:uncharacterized protein (TIGR02284 family)